MGNAASAEISSGISAIRTSHEFSPEIFDKLVPDTSVNAHDGVFLYLQPHHVRELINYRPRQLALILEKSIKVLENAAMEPYTANFSKVMNTVRLLTRIIPILLEEGDEGDFVKNVLWENKLPTYSGPEAPLPSVDPSLRETVEAMSEAVLSLQRPSNTSQETSAATVENAVPAVERTYEEREEPIPMPLGHTLVYSVMGLLFCPKLTLHPPSYYAFREKLDDTTRKYKSRIDRAQSIASTSSRPRSRASTVVSATAPLPATAKGPFFERPVLTSSSSSSARKASSTSTSAAAVTTAAPISSAQGTAQGTAPRQTASESPVEQDSRKDRDTTAPTTLASGTTSTTGAAGTAGTAGTGAASLARAKPAAEDTGNGNGTGTGSGNQRPELQGIYAEDIDLQGDEENQRAPDQDEDVRTEEEFVVPDEANAVWPSLLWASGLAVPSSVHITSSSAWDNNRIEILRLLLALVSGPLFTTPIPGFPTRSRFLDVFTSDVCPFAPSLFYSLLNTVLSYDPIGLGVPYAGNVVGDKRQAIVTIALQVLLVLIDYAPLVTDDNKPVRYHAKSTSSSSSGSTGSNGSASATEEPHPKPLVPSDRHRRGILRSSRDSDATNASSGTSPNSNKDQSPIDSDRTFTQFNVYRSLITVVTRSKDDSMFIFKSIARLLQSSPMAETSLLKGAYNSVNCISEILLLFWKFLEESPEFLEHILHMCDITKIVGPILYFMVTHRRQVTQTGLMHLCTYILLYLSSDRFFGVALNKSLGNVALPAGLPSLKNANYNDFLIVAFHKCIVNGNPKLSSLFSCLLTIISNISPYVKGLSVASATKLVNLLEIFTSIRYFQAKPTNYIYAATLLQIFTNIIQYQYESNPNIAYALVQRSSVFYDFLNMPLLPVASSPALSATSTSVTEVNAPLSLDAGKVASGTESVEGFGNPAAKASGEKERKGSSVVLNNTSSRHNAEKSEDITSLPEQVIQEMDTSPGSLQKVAAASIASSTMPHGTKLAETGKPQDATRLQEGKQGAERKHRKSRAASLQSQSHTPWISTEEWLHATIGSMPTFALKRMLDFLNSEMQTQKDKNSARSSSHCYAQIPTQRIYCTLVYHIPLVHRIPFYWPRNFLNRRKQD